MTVFLLGFCLVLFDLNIAAGTASVGVFPDALGYAMMLFAARGTALRSGGAQRFKRVAWFGAAATLTAYVLALAGALSWAQGWVWVGVDLLCFALECYTGFLVVNLMREADLSPQKTVSRKLASCWRLSVVFGAVSFFSVISPASTVLLGGMSFVADLYFAAMCFKSAPQCVIFCL